MSPKTKRTKPAEPARASADPQTPAVEAASPDPNEKIRSRAYALYIQRGQEPGYELDDWLQAEREIEGGLL